MFKILITFLSLFPLFLFASPNKTSEPLDFSISSYETPAFVTTFQGCALRNSSSLTVLLSDGSRWIINNKAAIELFADISKNWKIGDDIRIKKSGNDFVLKSVYSSAFYLANLDLSYNNDAIYYIEKVDKNGYSILTNDGSEWVFGWLGACSVQQWAPGQSVTINKSFFSREEDYCIINCQSGSEGWASLVTWK